MEFPFIKLILGQSGIGAKGAGGRSPLDHLVALAAHYLCSGRAQYVTGGLIHIQQLIGIHVADVDITLVGIHHKAEILKFLPVEPLLLLFFSHHPVHPRKFRL